MKAYILGVGNELTNGTITNTNGSYIAKRLVDLGIDVAGIVDTKDSIDLMVSVLRYAFPISDIIVITGGLGPTHDDLTREAIAVFTGLPLVFSEEAFKGAQDYFIVRKRPMGPGTPKEAFVPRGAVPLNNNVGVACGFWLEWKGKYIIALPGVPREARSIWEDEVMKRLERIVGKRNPSIFSFKIFGYGESIVEAKILDVIREDFSNVEILIGEPLEIKLNIRGEKAEEIASKIIHSLGDAIFTTSGETMEEVVVKRLIEKDITIAVAESCTGGLLSQRITSVPGSSKVFRGGFVPYSGWAKRMLGVPPYILQEGEVSVEIAESLANLARERLSSTIGIGITGNAGPTAGDPNQPVGYTCISLVNPDGCISREFQLEGDRDRVRFTATQWALDMIRRAV
ncbi:MAG: CinA family nicotinamide mononucleotide deamidase-related protein [bacterium]